MVPASNNSWSATLEMAASVAVAQDKRIMGVTIADLSQAAAIAHVADAINSRRHLRLGFCNAHTSNLAWADPEFRALLSQFTLLPDGFGVDIAATVLTGKAFTANLNGTDFMPALLSHITRPLRIALIGAKPGVAERASGALMRIAPQHTIVRILDGYAGPEAEGRFLASLAENPVDLLIVAMGNPRQENWIAAHVDQRHATVAVGVGAFFDFLAGIVPRAPVWVRRMRMEWVFRLMQEPIRLFRRYLVGNPLFLLHVLLTRLGLKRL
jgi:exopolysaccharide biosynthesis WecB/TagA/CpsF family protein